MILVSVSTGHFDALIETCNRLADRYEFFGQIGRCTTIPVFPYFRMAPPETLEEHIRKAELVVCHGGTGLLSSVYREKKRCVIVPRQRRYGALSDEQVPLARRWAELGMGTLCLDLDELEHAIPRCRAAEPTFRDYPPLGAAVRDLLHG